MVFNMTFNNISVISWQLAGPPRKISQGGTRLLWGPGQAETSLKIEGLRSNKTTTGKLS